MVEFGKNRGNPRYQQLMHTASGSLPGKVTAEGQPTVAVVIGKNKETKTEITA